MPLIQVYFKDLKKFLNADLVIALFAIAGLGCYLVLRVSGASEDFARVPLIAVIVLGGGPLVWELFKRLLKGQFGSDLLAGISIVTSLMLDEYAAGALVVLMLSGGEALEHYAVKRASSTLAALAKRMPEKANRKTRNGFEVISIGEIVIGDELIVLPHETSPVDGVVIDGRSVMDESYLTGEPYEVSKTPGSAVSSGAINGEGMLTIRAEKLPQESRYARIMEVMKRAEEHRPQMRRLADSLGAWYTPLAVGIATASWLLSNDPTRFLSVLVVATPCPLLIAIPITIIGSISLAAKRGILIKDPSLLEQLPKCQTVILDKTGTLTYGAPQVTEIKTFGGISQDDLLQIAGSVERFSKHPLAHPLVRAMEDKKIVPLDVNSIQEIAGQGLQASVRGHEIKITNRKHLTPEILREVGETQAGMECVVLVDDKSGGVIRFHDTPRKDSLLFIRHLKRSHRIERVIIVSGDRESEVRYLAEQVGIKEIYAGQSPEEKVDRVRAETVKSKTLFIGDGINDAPALVSATVGVALGQNSDITTEAAGAVILDSSLSKVDELFHISHHMRKIALQSAVGGMILSVAGMGIASVGLLSPVLGAIAQEVIDLVAVINSLRAGIAPREISDSTRLG